MAYSGGYSGDERESRSEDDRTGSELLLADKPTYLMEHLATFTVTQDTGIVYPADGMRRLLQLEKTNGIWSQKMQLCLDRSVVLIMDYETGSVMERFPASLIQEPTAFTSRDPMEMYNNILVFIVGSGGTSNSANPRSEMHIFQCQSISALDLVEDLKQLRLGKTVTQHRSNIPPPPAKSPPHPPGRDPAFNMYRGSDSEPLNDETSSTSSEKYERDVTILNHCFDDIEKFIARLQHAAAASRELERRRRSRKSKKRDLGDGILTMRTKPPPETEFVDIFQKFKLSFNLLAKLKSHIHDPNAPELVHFLFTPLALIVDASHDTYYDPNLPAKVVTPLLTREAVNLLINCVTSKETELWQSLGDAWLIPRDQWKGHVAPYHPKFLDGWSPDYPVLDEHEPPEMRRSMHPGDYGNEYIDYEPPNDKYGYPKDRGSDDDQGKMTSSPERDIQPGLRDFGAHSDISVDSIERNGERGFGVPGPSGERGQDAWAEDLQARGVKVVQVTYPRTANNDKELTVVRGEYLEILDDTRKWWKARNSRGQVAHVPHTIVTPHPYGSETGDIFNNPLYTPNYNKNNLHRQDSASDRYSAGPSSPANGASSQPASIPPPASADWIRNQHQGNGSVSDMESDEDGLPVSRSGGPAPPPPPPLPPLTTPSQTLKLTPSRANTLSRKSVGGQDEMQEELKHVLTLMREKRQNLQIQKTPLIFIQQSASADDIQKWLKVKKFDDDVCRKLNGVNGNELFGLSKKQLEGYFGPEEGNRLYSQILVQKSTSGYKTARSSELRAILAKARQKAGDEDY